MDWTATEHGYVCGEYVVGPAPNDLQLAAFYVTQRISGLLRRTFHVGPLMSLVEWLGFFLDPERPTFGCWQNGVLVGLGWVNGHETLENYKRGEVGFTFDSALPIFRKLELARRMLRCVLDRYAFDALVGTIPVGNPQSMRFARALGFKVCGPVDGYTVWESVPCGAWFVVLPKS